MKAAVLHAFGATPVYQDFADPITKDDEQVLINVKAASIKNIDKIIAGGKHPASHKTLPVVVGLDGVGVLEDGTRVYAQGITGLLAEKALISKHRFTVLPGNIDDAVAAALPNAVLGAALPILFRAKMQKGHTVLINGATGVTGKLAVQIARHYGAGKVIATGRNASSLEKLVDLGADATITLGQDDDTIISQLKEIGKTSPIDVVIDYLWGHPIELIIKSLMGDGFNSFPHPARIVTVGDMAGASINLPSINLRSSPVEILGSGIGSLSPDDWKKFATDVLPEMFKLAAGNKLVIDTQVEKLENVEKAWHERVANGKRLVISIN